MKHATQAALEGLSALLAQIRTREGLKEKKLGIFYLKSKSFLHFHEDPAGLFADLRRGSAFPRCPVNTRPERPAPPGGHRRAPERSRRSGAAERRPPWAGGGGVGVADADA